MKYNHIKDERFLFVMASFAEASGHESTPMKERVYAEGFSDIPIDVLEPAAWEMIRTRTLSSFPKIGEIREMLTGKVEDKAELEAAKVWEAIKRVGGWTSVVFDDATTQAVIQYTFGGWSKLCGEMMEDQQKWFIKDFVKAYGAYSRQKVTVTGQLSGRGIGDPVLIGDKEKALQIMQIPQEGIGMVTFTPVPAELMIAHKQLVDDMDASDV